MSNNFKVGDLVKRSNIELYRQLGHDVYEKVREEIGVITYINDRDSDWFPIAVDWTKYNKNPYVWDCTYNKEELILVVPETYRII